MSQFSSKFSFSSKFLFFVTTILLINFSKCDERGARVRRIVGGDPAPAPPIDDPVVFTRFAGRAARVLGVRDFPNYVFRGLRYGLPPVGKNRFLRPKQYFLDGYEDATKYPQPCVQPLPGANSVIGSEDCLFLNVFTPVLPTGMEGLPVIVWIHGGGFRYGSASQYGVRHLVGKQVIVVTIQYRLGSLGFLTTGSKELPGNAALWDMTLAVQWVRNYIGFFGGNPHKIVVMGHGTGASSAMLVALSNVAKGLSSGIVAMSGSAVSRWAVDDSTIDTAKNIAEENGCPTGSVLTMVKCLQNLSPASIIMGDSRIEFHRLEQRGFVSGLSGRLGTSPIAEGLNDGRALPGIVERDPAEDMATRDPPKIPLLTGITKDETKRACQGQYKKEILTKLQTVPNFLENVLVKNLQSSIGLDKLSFFKNATGGGSLPTIPGLISGGAGGGLQSLDPFQFRNYLQVQRNNFREGLAKISEATSDALFNVPAFLTASLWTRTGAPSYLYRFEHSGKRKLGHLFLQGFPLIGNGTADTIEDEQNTVGHGDELSYIFDPQDHEGRALRPTNDSSQDSDDDVKVREIFTQMIADFARHGKLRVDGQSVKSFSATDNNFLQITSKPKLANNFRYCEMALWIGLAQRLQSSSCQVFKVLDSQLKNVQSLFDTVPGGQNLGNLGNLGGIVPGGGRSGGKIPSIPGIGGGGGGLGGLGNLGGAIRGGGSSASQGQIGGGGLGGLGNLGGALHGGGGGRPGSSHDNFGPTAGATGGGNTVPVVGGLGGALGGIVPGRRTGMEEPNRSPNVNPFGGFGLTNRGGGGNQMMPRRGGGLGLFQ